MSTFANSVKRTCAAVCPLYGDVPMGAPGPPGQKGPPGIPVGFFFLGYDDVDWFGKAPPHVLMPAVGQG